MLVNGLAPEAAIYRVDGERWTSREELLAVAIERVDHWGLTQTYLNTDKKFHRHLPSDPLKIRRPGEKEREQGAEVETDAAKIAAFFG